MSAMLTREHTGPPIASGQPYGTGRPGADSQLHGPQTADDVVIGLALTAKWMITTGRRLGQRPLLHTLPADQLVDFWSDDHSSAPESAPPLARGPRRPAPSPPRDPEGGAAAAHARPEPPPSLPAATGSAPAPRATRLCASLWYHRHLRPTTALTETAMRALSPSPAPMWTPTCR